MKGFGGGMAQLMKQANQMQLKMKKLQEELVQDIMNTYKLEYALNQIGDAENISVEKSDVDALLKGIKDPQERAKAEQNSYVYTMMLRKQKIIDFLSGL